MTAVAKHMAQRIAARLPHKLKHRIKKRWQLLLGGKQDLGQHSFSYQQHELIRGDQLSEEFVRRGPWFSEFVYQGKKYGGLNSYEDDRRVQDFFDWVKPKGRVLELGSFEGAQSLLLLENEEITEVLGLEGRSYLIDKSNFIRELYAVENLRYLQSDFEIDDLSKFGRFDHVFCSGVLYHLTRPWDFIGQLAKVTKSVFLATHYAPAAETSREGFEGRLAPEFGYYEPLSGLNTYSFWLTLDSLRKAAANVGLELVNERLVPEWENGPWVNAYFVKK